MIMSATGGQMRARDAATAFQGVPEEMHGLIEADGDACLRPWMPVEHATESNGAVADKVLIALGWEIAGAP
jgi:hypothetical protein